MRVLGTNAPATVFRKLAELPYQTSYSHSGMYYALKASCKFDELGLWSHRKAWFSKDGTLLNTAQRFIHESLDGFTNAELDQALHVETRLSLLTLLGRGLILREKVSGVYLYTSRDVQMARRQLISRHDTVGADSVDEHVLAHELRAAIILFYSLLNEQQRRAFVGLESLRKGYGGDAAIARILNVDPDTVAKGRKELLFRDLNLDGIRRTGGGRKALKKTSGINRVHRGTSER